MREKRSFMCLLTMRGGRFAIDSATGQLTVANGALLNYVSSSSHSITIRVTDSGGFSYEETFVILVNQVELPTDHVEQSPDESKPNDDEDSPASDDELLSAVPTDMIVTPVNRRRRSGSLRNRIVHERCDISGRFRGTGHGHR